MTITPADLRWIAGLAELDVPEGDVDRLAAQLDRIVAHVAQLASLDRPAAAAFAAGPPAAPLRPDEVRHTPLDPPVEAMGPEVRDGLFLVPRLPGLDG